MKSYVALITGLVGAGTGFGAGFVIARKKYNAKADKEIASMEKFYKEKLNELTGGDVVIPGTSVEELVKSYDTKSDDVNNDQGNYINEPVDYTRFYNKDNAKEQPVSEELLRKVEVTLDDKIYEITDQEYQSGEYDVAICYLYSDGVLTDDDFNIIKDEEQVVGNVLHSRDVLSSNANEIYIRNDIKKVDYEIIRDDKKYSDILGESPRE